MRAIAWSAGVILAAWPVAGHAQQGASTPAPAPTPASTQQTDSGGSDDYADPADIVVTSSRVQPGAVVGDIKPELQLSPADVRSYGVSSIGDLLDELAPETASGRGSGRPAILLNGRRISDFRELRDLPTEAILRVDILPEQVALKYGFSADQKVVNIVLRQHFRAQTLEMRDKFATDGGSNTPHPSLGIVNITPSGRFSLNLNYQQTGKLLESQRDLTSTGDQSVYDLTGNITPAGGAAEIDPALSAAAGTPVTIAGVPASAASGAPTLGEFAANANQANATDLRRYRTLLPSSDDFKANAVYARTIFGNVQATVNGSVELTDSTSDQGLPGISVILPAGNPFSPFSDDVTLNRYVDTGHALQQQNQSVDTHLGTTFDGQLGKWNWSLTGNYDRTETKTFTNVGVDASGLQAALDAGDATVNPFGTLASPLIEPAATDFARSISSSGKVDALMHGSLLSLPAGSVFTSLHVGLETDDFSSHSVRRGAVQNGEVSRDIANGRLNIDVPIASRARDFLQPLGDLHANVNLAADHLSDFGTLTTVGYGVNWSPIESVRALVNFTDQDTAPSAQQLGNPTVITPNTRVFDYVNGTTVDVTQISGGNPDLAAATRHIFEAELNVKPLQSTDLRLIATYTATRTDNEIASLPAATAAIEAAFPDRFVRDDAGQLVSIDARPVNFDQEDAKQFRWGFNLSLPLKSKIQKEVEAYRAGKGENPFAGLRRQRHDQANDRNAGHDRPPADGGKPQAADNGAPPPPPPPGGDHGPGDHGGPGGFHGHGGFGRFGGGGRGSGRVMFAVYHTWQIEDRIHIRDGLPALDLLNGDTNGSSGGMPRHKVEVQAGYFNNGLGARLSGNWQSGTQVQGGTAAAPETLNFSPLATVNFRLFADLGNQLHFVAKHPWARGLRVTLSANNLFNSRQRVTDAAGATPVSYQPDYLDPLGRTVMISIRKLFFQRSAR
ncbi:MAG: TonB-dependent receptor [Sphingomonas sp.]